MRWGFLKPLLHVDPKLGTGWAVGDEIIRRSIRKQLVDLVSLPEPPARREKRVDAFDNS